VPSPRYVMISLVFACAAALTWGGQSYLGERYVEKGAPVSDEPAGFPVTHQGHEQHIDLENHSPLRLGSEARSLAHGGGTEAVDLTPGRRGWGADFFGIYESPRPLLDDRTHAIGDFAGVREAYLASPLPLNFGTAGIRSMSADDGGAGGTFRHVPEIKSRWEPTPGD